MLPPGISRLDLTFNGQGPFSQGALQFEHYPKVRECRYQTATMASYRSARGCRYTFRLLFPSEAQFMAECRCTCMVPDSHIAVQLSLFCGARLAMPLP